LKLKFIIKYRFEHSCVIMDLQQLGDDKL